MIELTYIGTQNRWPEISVTGKQSAWMLGQVEERSESEAALLMATGLFSVAPSPVMGTINLLTGMIRVQAGGLNSSLRASYRTVLFGDSMTDTYQTIVVPSALSYDAASGVLTVTYAGHQQASGWYLSFFHRGYASLIQHRRLPVTVIDANSFTINVGANLAGVPNGALSTAGAMYRPENWRSAQGFVTWLNALAGQRFNVVYNGAQSGDTVAQSLARIQQHCLDYLPDIVICQVPGINDMSIGNGLSDEETIHAGRCSIVSKLAGVASLVIVLSTTPVHSGEARATVQNMARLIHINRRLREFCQQVPGVVFVDAWEAVVNPTDTTGLAVDNLLRTTDNIHYSMRGARLIAGKVWTAVQSLLPSQANALPATVVDQYDATKLSLTSVSRTSGVITGTSNAHGLLVGELYKVTGGTSEVLNAWVTLTAVTTNTISFASAGVDGAITGTIYIGRGTNLFDNPILSTATGGTVVAPCTGTAASHIKIQNSNGTPTVLASVVARSDGIGNDQQIIITPAAASDQVSIEADFALASTLWPTTVKAGRSYYFEFELSLSGVSGSNLTEIRPVISAVVGGVTYQVFGLHGYADGACLNADQTALHIRTAPMVLPAGSVTNFKWQMVLRFSASGTALTVKVGRVALRESFDSGI